MFASPSKSCPAQRRNSANPTVDIAPEFIPSFSELTTGSGVALKGRIGSPMSQRAEHNRGYIIDGTVEVHPNGPDLPILRRAAFRVIHPAWTEALVEARSRIDAMLR